MKIIVCFFKGHMTTRSKQLFEDDVPIQIIEVFGGWHFSSGHVLCLRCGRKVNK